MSDGSEPVIGFIGVGGMGSPMASNLQKAGYSLVVHDIRREATDPHVQAGAIWADTPRAVAEQSDVVFTSLPGMAQIEEVVLGSDGVLAGMKPGGTLFETSTNSPDLLKHMEEAFTERGMHLLDAPISGGPIGAQKGKLAIWVGGDKEVFERYAPVLRVMGDRTTHVGVIGAGLITKVINNCASMSLHPMLAEIFSLGVKAGADPLSLWAAVRQGAVGSRRTFDGLADQFLPSHYDPPQGNLYTMFKDLTIATGIARELSVPMRFADLALADVTEAMNRGWADRDGRCVMLLAQERIGIHVEVDPEAIAEVFRQDPAAHSDPRH